MLGHSGAPEHRSLERKSPEPCSGLFVFGVAAGVPWRGWRVGLMRAEHVLAAWNMALETRRPASVIHHSEQGSRWALLAFGKRSREMGLRQRHGGKRFRPPGIRTAPSHGFKSKAETRPAVSGGIDGWYNPRRPTSTRVISRAFLRDEPPSCHDSTRALQARVTRRAVRRRPVNTRR